jgi:hypothetical protein
LRYRDDGTDLKIGICLSFYMELENLKRLIPSLRLDDPYGPQIVIAVDGVYEGFYFENRTTPQISDDGSREYLRLFKDKVALYEFSGYQSDKRQFYIKMAENHKCDVAIIVDADEYFHSDYSDWKSFRKQLVEYITLHDPNHNGLIFNLTLWVDKEYEKAHNIIEREQWHPMPRVWHRPEKMEYYGGVHYWVRHRHAQVGEVLGTTPITIYEDLRLVTDTKLRNADFRKARDRWALYGLKKEKSLKQLWTRFNGHIPAGQWTRGQLVNPLVCILQPRELEEPVDAIRQELIFVDKLWIKYHDQNTAYKIMQQTFLEHNEYSHLVILPDDLVINKDAYSYLYDDICKLDYGVVSGYCNLENTDKRKHLTNICISKLPPFPPAGHTLDDYNFATFSEIDELRETEGWMTIEVKFAGFPLTFIHRRIMQKIKFRDDQGCCPDSLFAWDLYDNDEQQFIDTRARMKHLKIEDGSYEKMQVGIKTPEVTWDYKQLA